MSAKHSGPLLAIDTSTSTGSVAVGHEGAVLAAVSLSSPPRSKTRGRPPSGGHSSALLPAVDFAMRSADLTPGALTGVVVGAGPGSFTGLRIAGATVKGIVHALEVPLFAYSSLMAVAAQAWASDRPVFALFDARGRDVYAACYRFGRVIETVRKPAAQPIEGVIGALSELPDALFIGDGAEKHREELERAGGIVAPPHFGTPSAVGLLWLVDRAPELGQLHEAAVWEPEYLRASGAERIAAAREREV